MSCCPHATPISPTDEVVTMLDFGPSGTPAPVTFNLTEGLKCGGIINAVICTDVDMAINIRDEQDNILLHVVARVTKNAFAVNSFLNGDWGSEVGVVPVPTKRNTKFVAMILYEQAGYRIFINGKDVAFYKHCSPAPPVLAEINGGVVYKAGYVSCTNKSE